ncbi:MAG: MarR family transcriptional regulator [Phycisphaerales bacterium]|nr:MAG: MarR family transcriptional regulator [Phycisphaerales bacterium]
MPHTHETLEKMAEQIFELSRLASLARSRKPAGPVELTDSEFLTLDLLAKHEPLTIGEAQKAIGVVPAQMSRIIRALEDREGGGYIKCSINLHDRRRIDVVLTDRGKQAHKKYREIRLGSITETLSILPPEDRVEFLRILGLIQGHIERSLQGDS